MSRRPLLREAFELLLSHTAPAYTYVHSVSAGATDGRKTQRGKTMSESYVRSSDDAMMIEVAPHQYVNRKIFHPRERLNDRHQREEAEDTSEEQTEAHLI
jgi:hypothetical protein